MRADGGRERWDGWWISAKREKEEARPNQTQPAEAEKIEERRMKG